MNDPEATVPEERRHVFGRVAIAAGGVVLLLAGMHLAAPVLNPILFGLFIGILMLPAYRWLLVRLKRPWLALTVLVLITLAGAVALGAFFVASLMRLESSLGTYQAQLSQQLSQLAGTLKAVNQQLGAAADAAQPERVTGILATFARGMLSALVNLGFALFVALFLIVEGPSLVYRLRHGLGDDHPLVERLSGYGTRMVRYFVIRTKINLLMGIGVATLLWVLGVDFPLLWGVLAFFLGYIPYIGLFLTMIPPVILAFAEQGPGTALLVIIGITIINLAIENAVQPAMLGKGLNLSPTLVFIMFAFWTWLLGPVGTILSMPITVFVMLLLDAYPDSRWAAQLLGAPESLVPPADGDT